MGASCISGTRRLTQENAGAPRESAAWVVSAGWAYSGLRATPVAGKIRSKLQRINAVACPIPKGDLFRKAALWKGDSSVYPHK
ncbi:hypothetical protein ES703_78589 [subsurface metagenome]